MKINYVDGKEYWTVDNVRDLQDWRTIEVEDWKEGIKRVHLMAPDPPTFRMVYCPIKFLGLERERLAKEFNQQAEVLGISLRA